VLLGVGGSDDGRRWHQTRKSMSPSLRLARHFHYIFII